MKKLQNYRDRRVDMTEEFLKAIIIAIVLFIIFWLIEKYHERKDKNK